MKSNNAFTKNENDIHTWGIAKKLKALMLTLMLSCCGCCSHINSSSSNNYQIKYSPISTDTTTIIWFSNKHKNEDTTYTHTCTHTHTYGTTYIEYYFTNTCMHACTHQLMQNIKFQVYNKFSHIRIITLYQTDNHCKCMQASVCKCVDRQTDKQFLNTYKFFVVVACE